MARDRDIYVVRDIDCLGKRIGSAGTSWGAEKIAEMYSIIHPEHIVYIMQERFNGEKNKIESIVSYRGGCKLSEQGCSESNAIPRRRIYTLEDTFYPEGSRQRHLTAGLRLKNLERVAGDYSEFYPGHTLEVSWNDGVNEGRIAYDSLKGFNPWGRADE